MSTVIISSTRGFTLDFLCERMSWDMEALNTLMDEVSIDAHGKVEAALSIAGGVLTRMLAPKFHRSDMYARLTSVVLY